MIEEVAPNLYRTEIPLPKSPLKWLNSYTVKGGDRFLIIDTGFNREECLTEMNAGMQKLGVDRNKTDIFITHNHVDHMGLAGTIAADGSKVYLNEQEVMRMNAQRDNRQDYWQKIIDVYVSTGTYTQLSTGTMNVSIGGTTVGTQYSQLKITGAASLGGTLTAAEVNAFVPTVGQTFTVLSAHSITGTFTNTTIAINATEHFVVSYTATSVVLTVASGPASTSGNSALPSVQVVAVNTKPVTVNSKHVVATSSLRHAVNVATAKSGAKVSAKPILVASVASGHSSAILASGGELGAHRGWTPAVSSWNHTMPVAVTRVPRTVNENPVHATLQGGNNLARAIGLRSALTGAAGSTTVNRLPVRILKPTMPRLR